MADRETMSFMSIIIVLSPLLLMMSKVYVHGTFLSSYLAGLVIRSELIVKSDCLDKGHRLKSDWVFWGFRVMKVGEVKILAAQWVRLNAATYPGFVGAYLTGSILTSDDGAEFPGCSDVDIFVVIEGADLPKGLGKFRYQELLLEVNFISLAVISDVKHVLADYHLAGAFRRRSALFDPRGKIDFVQAQVGAAFAENDWVEKRCADARARALFWLAHFESATALHDRVTGLFFAAGVTCHIVLVAALENPTIRRRYVASRAVLVRHHQLALHERFLETLGSAALSRAQVIFCLERVGAAYDLACAIMSSPYEFASDMRADMRVVAIGGAQEMIDLGFHREAMFWILAACSRARAVVAVDGSAAQLAALDQTYWSVLRLLGIENEDDMAARAVRVEKDIVLAFDVAMEIVRER